MFALFLNYFSFLLVATQQWNKLMQMMYVRCRNIRYNIFHSLKEKILLASQGYESLLTAGVFKCFYSSNLKSCCIADFHPKALYSVPVRRRKHWVNLEFQTRLFAGCHNLKIGFFILRPSILSSEPTIS